MTRKKYKLFKQVLKEYKEELPKEYIIDILILLKPFKQIEEEKIDKKNIGTILIEIIKNLDKLIEKEEEYKNEYIYLKENTLLLFKKLWQNNLK